MAIWPVDNKCTAIRERLIKPANKQESSAGYIMSFPMGTVIKKGLELQFENLTSSDKDLIKNFFNLYQGTRFEIDHPDPNENGTLTVVFDTDELEFEYVKAFTADTIGQYKLQLKVREA